MINSFRNMVKRCFTSASTPNDNPYPALTVNYHGKQTTAEHLTPYGFYSSPPANCTGIVLTISGQEENLIALVNTPKKRPRDLAAGEVSVYHPVTKSEIHFKANGDIEISSVDGTIKCASPHMVVSDSLVAGVVEALVKNDSFKAIFDAHVHTGVAAGGANSGPPSSPLPASVATEVLKAK